MPIDIIFGSLGSMNDEGILKPQIKQLVQCIHEGKDLQIKTIKGELHLVGDIDGKVNKLGKETLDGLCELVHSIRSYKFIFTPDLEKDIEEIAKFCAKELRLDKKEPTPLKRPPLSRNRSLPDLNKLRIEESTKIEEFCKKDSEMWKCVDRNRDHLYGGYVYIFQAREEFDFLHPKVPELDQQLVTDILAGVKPDQALTNFKLAKRKIAKLIEESCTIKNQEIYPAIEPTIQELTSLFSDPDLKDLGYSMETKREGVFFLFPDREALQARWAIAQSKRAEILDEFEDRLKKCQYDREAIAKLCQESKFAPFEFEEFLEELANPVLAPLIWHMIRPDMPDFDIASGDGIADDPEFISNWLSHDVLLTSGSEFIHDQYFHALRTIKFMLKYFSKGFKKEKFRLVKLVCKAYRRIEIAKKKLKKQKNEIAKMELTLGLIVDAISSKSNTSIAFSGTGSFRENLADDLTVYEWTGDVASSNQNIWKKRFGNEPLNHKFLKDLWTQIKEIEVKFDESRAKKSG